VSGSFTDDGLLDISKAPIVICAGRKGSGKTVTALMYAQSFPYDAVVIDVAGDDGPMGPGIVEWSDTAEFLPRRFPSDATERDGDRIILRYVPDAGSPTFLQDMDAVVGIAMHHSTKQRPCLLVVHEAGVLAPANKTQPHMRRVLAHSRHNGLVCVFTMPRTQTIDPAIIGQSDVGHIFDLPNPHDRKRVAEEIGWDPRAFANGVAKLEQFESLRYDVKEPAPAPGALDYRLIHCPPLPAANVEAVERWARARQPALSTL
jgi:hypothetical protein